ncbi:hypothetical protein ACOSQ2_030847 [Xanthoceras sorbifolium]
MLLGCVGCGTHVVLHGCLTSSICRTIMKVSYRAYVVLHGCLTASASAVFVANFQVASVRGCPVPKLVHVKKVWVPPLLGYFKLNVDASFDQQVCAAGLGAIVRDDCGGVLDVEMRETLALLEGLKMDSERNIFPLLIESDSLNVVNICNDLIFSRAEVGVIIQEIKLRIASINISSISHVCRSCNLVARVVARKALASGCNSFWVRSYPSWLLDAVVGDFPDCCFVSGV